MTEDASLAVPAGDDLVDAVGGEAPQASIDPEDLLLRNFQDLDLEDPPKSDLDEDSQFSEEDEGVSVDAFASSLRP